jgi:hypothetical protein
MKETAVTGIRIGELLVEQGVLTQRQVQQILQLQHRSGRPFGDLAERLFAISPKAVEDAWVRQYTDLAGIAELDELEIDHRCLLLLSSRQAWQFHLLPLHYDRRGELQMATTADHLVRALNFSTRTIAHPVYMLVCEPDRLCAFLMRYYPVPGYIAQYAQML